VPLPEAVLGNLFPEYLAVMSGCEHVRNANKSLFEEGVFWDVMPCGSVRTDVSEELTTSFFRVTRISELLDLVFLRSVRWLLVTASVVPSSPILVILMEALSSSETSVLTRATRRNIPKDGNLHSHRRKNSNLTNPYSFRGRSSSGLSQVNEADALFL
jgi:hypothetical protein